MPPFWNSFGIFVLKPSYFLAASNFDLISEDVGLVCLGEVPGSLPARVQVEWLSVELTAVMSALDKKG